jgi:hypothetical protein
MDTYESPEAALLCTPHGFCWATFPARRDFTGYIPRSDLHVPKGDNPFVSAPFAGIVVLCVYSHSFPILVIPKCLLERP